MLEELERELGSVPDQPLEPFVPHDEKLHLRDGHRPPSPFFPSMERYVDGVREMVDVVGVDHVCIGTDQQTTPGALQDYGNFARVVDALLQKGFTAAEAGKLAGGNFVRIFAQSAAA